MSFQADAIARIAFLSFCVSVVSCATTSPPGLGTRVLLYEDLLPPDWALTLPIGFWMDPYKQPGCDDGELSPPYSGPGTYTFNQGRCERLTVDGRKVPASWSGALTVNYGKTCDNTHASPWLQTGGGCKITRTTGVGESTLSLQGDDGHMVAHSTHGAGTGWAPDVSPAPNNEGIVSICGSRGCASSSGSSTLVINGSHFKGIVGGKFRFDHTLTGKLSIQGTATAHTVNGSVTVQHNLARYTVTATFSDVAYGLQEGCCFPTSGRIETTVPGGGSKTLAFTSTCGEATLTRPDRMSEAYALKRCPQSWLTRIPP